MINYIAIDTVNGFWGKGDTPKEALTGANINRLKTRKTFKGVRLIEVEYSDDTTDRDDVVFQFDGSYTLKGDAQSVHYDEAKIAEFLKIKYE